MLSKAAKEDLARSGISAKDAKRAGLFSVNDASELFSEFKQVEGLVLPYFGLDGEPLRFERDGEALPFCRVRYIREEPAAPTFGKRKKLRYAQPRKSGCWPYFPVVENWQEIASDTDIPIVITEGEKKALRATLAGIPTIGLGGVHNFMRDGEFLEELEQIEWQGRPVYIAFDSDAEGNPNIQAAEGRLASELSMRRKATLFLARTPELADGQKAGIDDFIEARGEDAWFDVLDQSKPMRRIDQAVVSLNEHVCYIEREAMILDLHTFNLMRPESFRNGSKYSAMEILAPSAKGSTKRISVASEWLRHPHAQRYDQILFKPETLSAVIETEDGGRALNMWRGLHNSSGDVTPFLDLYEYVMSEADENVKDLLFNLMAYKAQNPGEKIPLAPLLVGLEGSGKTLLADCFREAFAPYGVEVSPRAFTTDYNDWMERSLVATVNEIEPRDMEGGARAQIRSAISEKRQQMNAKYRPARQIDCYTTLIFTSNKRRVAAYGADDRRMVVISCPPKHSDDSFYGRVFEWREKGGPKALLHYLLTYDLQGWKPPAKAPMTAEKYMAYMENLTPAQRLAEDAKTADDHVVYLWIEEALTWARTAEATGDPATAAIARDVMNLDKIEVRPWYAVDELATLFPMIAAQLYRDNRRAHSVSGELSRQLREAGVTYLRNSDDARGFRWRGRIQQFLVLADQDEWGGPVTQKEFDYWMKRFPRFKEYRAAKKKRESS